MRTAFGICDGCDSFRLYRSGAAKAEHKVGIIVPTTGPLAFLGSRLLATYQWWEREANSKGGINGSKVRLVHCNDEGSPVKASACARDLIGQGVKLLINGSVAGSVNATIPLVADGPVMLVVSTFSHARERMCTR